MYWIFAYTTLNNCFYSRYWKCLLRRTNWASKRITCRPWSVNLKATLNIVSSSSSIFHAVGPLVDPSRSHVSRSLCNCLPWFLLPVGEYCFITLGNLLRGILFNDVSSFSCILVVYPELVLFLIPLNIV